MMKVGLVDDQKYDLEKLHVTVSQLPHVDIVFSTNDAEEAYEQIKKNDIDLLITDIEMPRLSGYELADFINSYALDIKVIFVTGHSGFAVHAFELDVLDYIMKPYSRDRLLKGIARFEQKKEKKEDHDKLMLKQKTEMQILNKKDIVFIERTGRSTTIVTTNGEYSTYQSLSELEPEFQARHFLRSHRAFIINIHYVKNFSLYTKHSYSITFQQTNKTALITKANLDKLQKEYF
ncbi:LytTR family DNA-binding domain-containing protein [Bacillus sp. CGMCC 1.16541]|uniref:LytR/AlgR family response regulator transcription factor n=1 Tax=Bacillus sp. CGMCC 1.16541 TaxID=2185143 RepID=UPI00194DCCD8|nr:LytTR family DNA-binding domain-containing protein [Bacillus sp. CGMCC 1.16541]